MRRGQQCTKSTLSSQRSTRTVRCSSTCTAQRTIDRRHWLWPKVSSAGVACDGFCHTEFESATPPRRTSRVAWGCLCVCLSYRTQKLCRSPVGQWLSGSVAQWLSGQCRDLHIAAGYHLIISFRRQRCLSTNSHCAARGSLVAVYKCTSVQVYKCTARLRNTRAVRRSELRPRVSAVVKCLVPLYRSRVERLEVIVFEPLHVTIPSALVFQRVLP